MLVLHPSSRCDVCLESYSWSNPPSAPHAIACGHIFCFSCLQNLSPALCPLCRKAFQPDRVKKLHVDHSSEDVAVVDSEVSEFLQRVALVSGEESPDSQIADVLVEVEAWLERQPVDQNSSRPVRAAVDALRRYKSLQEASKREKDEFQYRRRQHQDQKHALEQDLQTARAVEESLLAKVEEISKKFDDADAELTYMKAELARLRNMTITASNPLPIPPKPSDRHAWSSGSEDNPGAGGYGRSLTPTSTLLNSHRSGSSDERLLLPRATTKTAKSGKMPIDDRSSPVAGSSRIQATQAAPSTQSGKHPYTTDDILYHHLSSSAEASDSRVFLAPGATYNERAVPSAAQQARESRRIRSDGDQSITERAQNGGSYVDRVDGMDRNLVPRYGVFGGVDRYGEDVDDTRFASVAAFISGYASGFDQGVQDTGSVHEGEYVDFTVEESPDHRMPEHGVGTLGLIGVPEAPELISVLAPEPNSRPIVVPIPRREGISINQLQRGADAMRIMTDPSTRAGSYPSRRHTQPMHATQSTADRATHQAFPGESSERRGSVSSWGTVNTGDIVRDGRGSLSDLSLIGLPPPGTGEVQTPSDSDHAISPTQSDAENDGHQYGYNTPVISVPLLGTVPHSRDALGIMVASRASSSSDSSGGRRHGSGTTLSEADGQRSLRFGPSNTLGDGVSERLSRVSEVAEPTPEGAENTQRRHGRSASHSESRRQPPQNDRTSRRVAQPSDRPEVVSDGGTSEPRSQRRQRSSTVVQGAATVQPAPSLTLPPPHPYMQGVYYPSQGFPQAYVVPPWNIAGAYAHAPTAAVPINPPVQGGSQAQSTRRSDNSYWRGIPFVSSVRNATVPWSSR